MRFLATGRSVDPMVPEDPWLCVPASRRVCPVSDQHRGRRSSPPQLARTL